MHVVIGSNKFKDLSSGEKVYNAVYGMTAKGIMTAIKEWGKKVAKEGASAFKIVSKSFPGGKGERFKNCVNHFVNDPKFEARGGKTKEESAQALCSWLARRKYGPKGGK